MTDLAPCPDLRVVPLQREEFPLAWPLARRGAGTACLASWEAQVEALCRRGGGVLAARTGDGLVHGIAIYEPAQRVLRIGTLASFELNRRRPTRRALWESIVELAARLGCERVELVSGCAA